MPGIRTADPQSEAPTQEPSLQVLDTIYREDSRRILATLIRLLGDFDMAEDALQDAFRAAAEKWPTEGVPTNPRSWLISAGRFRALDALRRRVRFDDSREIITQELYTPCEGGEDAEDISDDRLRLIFTCCHPALAAEARTALTLREVCGLTTEEIARAFLSTPTTIAQRIVRAKAKIRDARIPYQVPAPEQLSERLDTVLQVIYLVFNEGYSASAGETLTRPNLSREAIRLGRLVAGLLPNPEVLGLLALMLLQESRRAARTSESGDLILLQDQDRSLWDRALITEGLALVTRALDAGAAGPFTLQAAIAAVHSSASRPEAADWPQIVRLYDELMQVYPSPVVELNRAVAVAMRDGAAAGLSLIDELLAGGELDDYHLAHATRAELCRRLGRQVEAKAAYRRALELARQGPEQRFLAERLQQLV